MRSATCALLLTLAFASAARGATPHISFTRTVRAPHDLGQAEELVVLYALGDHAAVSTFVETFAGHANESNALHITNATSRGPRPILGEKTDEATMKKLRRLYPADAYLGVNEFSCRGTPQEGESSSYDVDRRRVRKKVMWLDAVCSARVDVIDAATFRRDSSFAVKGEGTSPRVELLGEDERNIAYEQAARYAALAAAEQITPRRVRESIPLEATAPSFEEGMARIDLSRFEEARMLWESALKKNPRSAALRYNLAALCEAIGDLDAARRQYIEARRLSPKEQRYEDELRGFIRRNTQKP